MKLESHTNLTEKERVEISVKQQKQVEKEFLGVLINTITLSECIIFRNWFTGKHW